ncbi:MAG: sugar transferase [Acidobacteria bacterium]|nr:sugar transferase [Acidobacteriota bacterium]
MSSIRRILDILLSAAGLILLSPLFLVCAIAIRWGSPGRVLYRQAWVGRRGTSFPIFKFRSMEEDGDEGELLVTGEVDPRITSVGRWLRKYKLDELPQLFNVLRGDMSFVGPRPRVEKYARHYPEELREILYSVRPGITDPATLQAIQQEQVLGQVSPERREQFYLEKILPVELGINVNYIRERTLGSDLRILFKTVLTLLGRSRRGT